MDIIIRVIQLILALSILVLVHEFGHYFFARLFKIKVEQFYLFFPPALFKYKPKNSDTEFGIGSIPLGGFCKISGMIDESMDKDAMAKPPQPWEFRTKPAWQRLLVMFGGVFFNFILAIIIFTFILMVWGEQYLKNENAKYGIHVNELAYEIGFRNGDKILSFDGEEIVSFSDLQMELIRSQAEKAIVLRGSDTIEINIDPAYMPTILNTPGMFELLAPIAIAGVPETSANINSGLAVGDLFKSIDSISIRSLPDLQKNLEGLKNQTANFTFQRDEELITLPLNVDENGNLGVNLSRDLSEFDITKSEYSIISAIPAGINRTFSTIGDYIKELKLIFSPETEAYKSVGSFISIGSIFPTKWDWHTFWNITGWLSIMLAVLNILPIPALDGGHIIFTVFEIITGRKPSDKFLEYAQIVGMVLLLTLIILAFGNDIYKLFK